MKRITTILTFLMLVCMGAWATDVLPTAVVGTYAFQTTTLTTGASAHTISKDSDGNVTISPNNSGAFGATSGRFTCTLVVKINVPSTTTAGVLCEMRQGAANTTNSQGLYMIADRKLKTSWQGNGRQSDANATQLTADDHTIIFTTGDSGSAVYVDGNSKLTDSGLKASGVSYKAIYIPAAYASYITEVHFFSSIQDATNITAINTECSNRLHASQQSGTTANIASGKTLILDKAVAWTSLTGTGTVLQEVNIATTVAGNLPALTLKATAGTLTYTGASLNGTTLDGVILGGSARINTSNTVTIKNLAGNNISGTNGYAFVGSGTLNFYGTCDLTKQSDGSTTNSNSNVGYGSATYINIKEDANVTTGAVFNTSTSNNNAKITVESGATLSASGQIRSIYLTNNGTITSTDYIVVYADNTSTNNGTITATQFWGPITFAEGSTTTLSDASPFNSGAVTVSGDAELNLTAAEAITLSQAITIGDGKSFTIDGNNQTLTFSGSLTNNGTVNFKNATFTLNRSERNLSGYTFTDCTATLQLAETTDEYKAGGFTITNIPSGVTIKVKKYGATDYETVTPTDGTATISHSVGVSGTAAWLDYTFNESTKSTNLHDPADQIITNAGNAGSGNNLTIDVSYTTATCYNDDGTLKVMSTPWRNITWPANYTVAVAGNVPDVENGCLVAFGSTTSGSKNYLAIIRGASQNEIKLVKGCDQNNAFEVITTMSAANATALSHLVVFTKNGNTFTVYLDGVQKAQVTYSETLGGGFQIGSIHGNVTGTGISRVDQMSDATAKAKVFAKAIRVYDYVISDDQMSQLTDEFPYTSLGGKYTRTISEDSDLSDTDAWLNAGTQGNVDVPVNATVDEVTYYPDVEITTTAASTLTVNADMDAENIKFEGAGKLTIASDGSHNISVYGSFTANGPVSVKYGEIDLSGIPVTIGGSGSVEFDFSDCDFSDVIEETNYNVTGNTSDYGSKVTGVYPDDEDHTFALAHDDTSNRYVLTVGPSVILKQKQAIALVVPYYNGILVGNGVGKYTISLGATSYSNLVDFRTAVESWESISDCVVPTITLNQPATGKFYRFHIGDKYMCNVAVENVRTATTTADDASTIFYLDEDSYLIAYADGFGFNYGYCKATAPGIFNSFDFSESSTKGKYLIHSNPGTESNEYSSRYITISESSLDQGQGEWTIEEVTSLPIAVNQVGDNYYATLYMPVPVSISEGTTAYTLAMTTDKNWLTPTAVDGNVPAEQPVLLVGTSSSVTATVESTAGSKVDTPLKGTLAAKTVTAETDYFLGKYSSTGEEEDSEVGFYKWTGTTLKGFRAYLPAKALENAEARGFAIKWNDDVTSVHGAEFTVHSPKDGVFYDLQGRRVQNPQHGLYIVNGKKVVIK